VAKLRSYHNAAQKSPPGDPKKAFLRYGLDLLNGEIRDNVAAGILEPTMGKTKSLKSAYEAAIALLRIDDAIQCVPGELGANTLLGDMLTKLGRATGRARPPWTLEIYCSNTSCREHVTMKRVFYRNHLPCSVPTRQERTLRLVSGAQF